MFKAGSKVHGAEGASFIVIAINDAKKHNG